MRRLPLLLLPLLMCLPAKAQQVSAPPDSSAFRASQLVAPSVLGGTGLALHFLAHNEIEVPVFSGMDGLLGSATPFVTGAGEVGRFLPSAMHLTLAFAGADSRVPFTDRLIESVIGHSLSIGLGYAAKLLLQVPRPDGSDSRSMPSGHTLLAFTGAELTRLDYGNLWGAGAYAVSTATAASRLCAGRHWLGDLFTGAGLGILCAHAGKWLLGPVKSALGISGTPQSGVQVALAPASDPMSGTPLARVAVVF